MRYYHFVGYLLLAACPLYAQAPSPSVSKVTIQQALERAQELEEEISHTRASMPVLPPKDQFESTSDYTKRNQAWFDMEEQRVGPLRMEQEKLRQQLYLDSARKPEFVSYDADSEVLTASIFDGKCLFKIPRTSAKEMHDSWSSVSVAENLELAVALTKPRDATPPGTDRSRTQTNAAPAIVALVSGHDVYIGLDKGDRTSPQLQHKVEPELSEEARKAKLNGTVVLSIVVDTDGRVQDIEIVRGPGMGLEEKAIEAVQKWTFIPGREGCIPVKVRATVEVNFRAL
jgi:TonB family protein